MLGRVLSRPALRGCLLESSAVVSSTNRVQFSGATRAPITSPHTLGLAPSSHTAYFSTSLHRMGGGSVGDGGESVMTPELKEKIDKMVQESDVVVFMKGVPSAPQCGFSNAVAQIFRMHDVPIVGHNVLADEDVRQGIKEYSNWPTIPQVFFKGEFMGGCDIMIEMHQSGELIEELDKIGIKSALKTPAEE